MRQGWTIAVPRRKSFIVPVNMLDEDVFAEHILKPSTLFKDEYVSCTGKTLVMTPAMQLETKSGRGCPFCPSLSLLTYPLASHTRRRL